MMAVEVLDEVWVMVANKGPTLNGRANPNNVNHEQTKQEALAIHFICCTNDSSYLKHLRNSCLDGNNYFLTTAHNTYNFLQLVYMKMMGKLLGEYG